MKKNPFTSYVMAFCVTAYWKMTVTWHISGIRGSVEQSMLSLPAFIKKIFFFTVDGHLKDFTGGGDG